jgi:hypothetical protein
MRLNGSENSNKTTLGTEPEILDTLYEGFQSNSITIIYTENPELESNSVLMDSNYLALVQALDEND